MDQFLKIFLPSAAIVGVFTFVNNKLRNVVYITSTVDGRSYLVRDLADKQDAADLLAKVNKRIMTLISNCQVNPENGFGAAMKRLESNFNPNNIAENQDKSSKLTAFTVNKGDEIVFCLRCRKCDNPESLHDINTLMFVAIHELAHMATKSEGHTAEFTKNFKYLLNKAMEFGVWRMQNYRQDPVYYCGTLVNDLPI